MIQVNTAFSGTTGEASNVTSKLSPGQKTKKVMVHLFEIKGGPPCGPHGAKLPYCLHANTGKKKINK